MVEGGGHAVEKGEKEIKVHGGRQKNIDEEKTTVRNGG